ncbi:MAG: hypothetical protein IJZ04_00895 [Clostridia bacterium]|nr:hypothetical protein [Clostridia bacterium]
MENHLSNINELRFRKNSFISLIAGSKNINTSIYIRENDIENLISSLCGGSIYAHFNTIRDGYISLGNGMRAGVCGKAICENGKITAISDISSINIRFPRRIYHSADLLYDFLEKNEFKKSVLLYSAPGVGKTSILRELIYLISKKSDPPVRHAVIDSREEITPFMDRSQISSDIFVSYPKGLAIEIATKSMTPELIICDEISSLEEATAVLQATGSGVRIVATCHASSLNELLSKEILKDIFSHRIFDYAIGVKRKYGSSKYEFSLDRLN